MVGILYILLPWSWDSRFILSVGSDCPRSREGKNMLEVSFFSLLTEKEEETITSSVLLAEEQSGFPSSLAMTGVRSLDCHASLAMTGMRSLDCHASLAMTGVRSLDCHASLWSLAMTKGEQ